MVTINLYQDPSDAEQKRKAYRWIGGLIFFVCVLAAISVRLSWLQHQAQTHIGVWEMQTRTQSNDSDDRDQLLDRVNQNRDRVFRYFSKLNQAAFIHVQIKQFHLKGNQVDMSGYVDTMPVLWQWLKLMGKQIKFVEVKQLDKIEKVFFRLSS